MRGAVAMETGLYTMESADNTTGSKLAIKVTVIRGNNLVSLFI